MPPEDEVPGDAAPVDMLGESVSTELAFLATAIQGDHLATLQGLRDLLAQDIARASQRGLMAEVSSLTGRLQSVLDRIAQLAPDTGKGTALDEFTKRRQARKATSPSRATKRQ